ncbi:Rrf2 family transcriptional regulator [Paenibacillus sp. P36]|uniref:Rrf2 family transcriptional regulator n=1 Tax=Paenibacillus sp. P36 TaxID=3342538 RepID=UPI0038B40517
MVNTRLSVAIHIMSLVHTNPKASSDMIAGSVSTNPVVIRRITSMLKKSGLLSSRVGVAGFALTKSPSEITLYDIYKSVQLESEIFNIHDNPNPNCTVGREIQQTLDVTFESVKAAMENELRNKTLQDVIYHIFK